MPRVARVNDGSRNMRISTAYFAGVGTVIVAVAAGLGGGYLAANITNPPTQEVSKLERRMSAEPISVATAPAEPVSRVVATNPASAPAQPQPLPQPQTEAAAPSANAAPSTNNVRAEEKPPLKRRPIMSRQRGPYSRRCNLSNPPNRPKKRSLRLGMASRETATPTSNARTPKSVGPSGASAGPTSAASSSRASRSSRRLRRASGK